MKNHRLVALAAALSASVAFPAVAQNYPVWDRIGSVDFSVRPDREAEYGNFGGPVQRLSFRAAQSDVVCRDVSASFNNGRTRTIFTGTLPRGRDVVVDLPGRDRTVRRIDFDCRATAPRGSRVDIAADIGQYRAEWRASPEWARTWSRMFAWANDFEREFDGRNDNRGDRGRYDLVRLSRERFDGRESETTIVGQRGRALNSVALRPLDNDARCVRVGATFRNGRTAELSVNRGARMVRNQFYELDLPGGQRNIERIDMTCRGERGYPVTIEVFGNR